MLSVIVAMGENRVIGAHNAMPWHLPEDLRRFRAMTLGHPIVMGRKTFEAIGRVLPGRENLIVSRNPGLTVEGARVHGSLEAALESLDPAAEVFLIGGAELYRQGLPRADRIELTLIHRDFEGDTFFPPIDPRLWRETARSAEPESNDAGLTWSYVQLERVHSPERPPLF